MNILCRRVLQRSQSSFSFVHICGARHSIPNWFINLFGRCSLFSGRKYNASPVSGAYNDALPSQPRGESTSVLSLSATLRPETGNQLTSILQTEQKGPADARVTRDSAVIPRWPSAAILDFTEPIIAPFDPPTPKTIALNQTWCGSDAPFARYSPLNS